MITAPAANTAKPCSIRSGNESLNPSTIVIAPSTITRAAAADNSTRRSVGSEPCIAG